MGVLVILVGGNSCTGKTLMAQTLLLRYHIPYFSLDHLKMGLYKSDRDCGFTPWDPDDSIARHLWPFIRALLGTVIENRQSIIVEGCYLLPGLVTELKEYYPQKIISVFLSFTPRYIRDNFITGIMKHRNIMESRGEEERPLVRFIKEHEDFQALCAASKVDLFSVDDNYEEEIQRVYEFIHSEVQRMGWTSKGKKVSVL